MGYEIRGLAGCKNMIFSLTRDGVLLLFNGLLALLVSSFYVIHEFDSFLH